MDQSKENKTGEGPPGATVKKARKPKRKYLTSDGIKQCLELKELIDTVLEEGTDLPQAVTAGLKQVHKAAWQEFAKAHETTINN